MSPATDHEVPARPGPEREPAEFPGGRIVVASWVTTVVFALTALADRAGIDALEPVATAAALVFFASGVVLWLAGFWRAVSRSRQEEITLTGLFFLVGTAPRPVQIQLLGSLVVAIGVAAATATAAPFGVMEPVLPLALAELWAARHGVFRARAVPQSGNQGPSGPRSGTDGRQS